MDWAKAKTILIIALIVTDIFLIATYAKRGDSSELKNDDALITVLAENEIYIEKDAIPKKHGSMPTLSVEQIVLSDDETEALIEAANTNAGGDDYAATAANILSELGLDESDLTQKSVEENGGAQISFVPEADGKELAGSYISFEFEEGRLTDIECSLFMPQEFSKKKLPIISAETALIRFISEKEDDAPANIEKMELVYWINRDSYESSSALYDTALPAWKILLDDGREYYIEALEK